MARNEKPIPYRKNEETTRFGFLLRRSGEIHCRDPPVRILKIEKFKIQNRRIKK